MGAGRLGGRSPTVVELIPTPTTDVFVLSMKMKIEGRAVLNGDVCSDL